MSNKIGTSCPMVLDVLLPPFTESFRIDPSDTLQQWHYDADGSFLPDRAVTPLLLRPKISVFDPETYATYDPSWYKVRWYLLNPATGNYDIEITNTDDGDVDYVVMPNGDLMVKKNVVESAPVNILCSGVYVDPRNAGKTWSCSGTVQLVTNRDTSVTSPTIEVNQESTVKYNPFIDPSSRFTFVAKAYLGEQLLDLTGASSPWRIEWWAIGDGETSEQKIDTTTPLDGINNNTLAKFPCYVSGQNTPTLVVDAAMTDGITIIARIKNTAENRLYPEKCLRTLTWDSPKLDATSEALDSGAIKQDTASKTLRNIVTMRNQTLTEQQVNDNFLQAWKYRKASYTSAGGTTPTDAVQSLITAPQLKLEGAMIHQYPSSLVYAELELLQGYKVMMQNGKPVVQDGKVVICRY